MAASGVPISIPFRDARFGESLRSEGMARMIAAGAGKMAAFRGWFLFSLGLTIATVSVIPYFADCFSRSRIRRFRFRCTDSPPPRFRSLRRQDPADLQQLWCRATEGEFELLGVQEVAVHGVLAIDADAAV